jgi:hypothetical protein
MLEDIGKAVIGWGVTILGAWLLTKIPGVKKWLSDHPLVKSVALILLIGLLASVTAVAVYDRYIVAPQFALLQRTLFGGSNAVIAAPGNRCPPGSYAVALSTVSVSGGNRGYLESATITCMELKFAPK